MLRKLLLLPILLIGTSVLPACSSSDNDDSQQATWIPEPDTNSPPADTIPMMPTSASEGNEDDFSAEDQPYTESESEEEEPKVSGSDYTIRQYMKDYERYMMKYVDMMKKAQNNDMSAMQDYMEALQQVQEIQSKLGGMESEMTASDLAEFQAMNERLVIAMQEAGR